MRHTQRQVRSRWDGGVFDIFACSDENVSKVLAVACSYEVVEAASDERCAAPPMGELENPIDGVDNYRYGKLKPQP